MKFEAGKKYVVAEGLNEGVVIKITEIDGRLINFDVVEGEISVDFFERDSDFSKRLKKITE